MEPLVTISRELPAEEMRTRNGGDKDRDLDGKERNKEKRKEMKGCQSYGEQSKREKKSEGCDCRKEARKWEDESETEV